MKDIVLACLRKLLFSLVKPSCQGFEKIPASGPVILAGNHPNSLDGLVVGLLSPRPVRFLVAGELFRVPLVGTFLAWLGSLPVERRTGQGNGRVFRAAEEALARGELVALFPEGHIDYGKELLEFKQGVALLALKTGAPVVPFGLAGTEQAYPEGAVTVRAGRVVMAVGDPRTFPAESGRISSARLTGVLESIKADVKSCWERARTQLKGPLPRPGVWGRTAAAVSLIVTVSTRAAFSR